jgi:uncharacterized protein (TIGR00255 family)
MTGFGRGEAHGAGVTWLVECSAVNRKALEVVINLPRDLAELENAARAKVSAVASRGRVNVSVKTDTSGESASVLKVDEALAAQYVTAMRDMAERLSLTSLPTAADMTRCPGVFRLEEGSTEPTSAWPLIEKALDAALARLVSMRESEGAHLKADMTARLETLAALLVSIGRLSPQVVDHYRKQLRQRLEDAGVPLPLDDDRLVKEIALFADRCDVSEELTRAASHLKQFHTYLAATEPMGRSLDFLTQELAREFNTIGSKANNAEIAHLVVTGKTEIEKIREQVQNVE